MKMYGGANCLKCIVCILGVALLLLASTTLLEITPHKEGFEDATHVTPQQFSQQLLAAVMPPIKRLSSMLTDTSVWKERFAVIDKTPAELARAYLQKK